MNLSAMVLFELIKSNTGWYLRYNLSSNRDDHSNHSDFRVKNSSKYTIPNIGVKDYPL